MTEEDLEIIKKYQKELKLLAGVSSLLSWDTQTYMPEKGNEVRSEQISFIHSLRHKKLTSDELFNALRKAKEMEVSGDEKIMVERLYHDAEKSRKIPQEFAERLAKACASGFSAWKKAREEKDFKVFQPHLEKIVGLKREEAKYLGFPGHLYNGLLDDYEEGMTVEILKPKLEKLKKEILGILEKIKFSEKYKNQKFKFLNKNFSKEHQIELTKDVMQKIGLLDAFSRIDIAEHPFTIRAGTEDVRITTNVREDPLFAFFSTMHEAGHGLYELNLPKENIFTTLYDAPSLGIHESQSRFWEIMIGKSKPFWKHYFEEFGKRFGINDFDKWYGEINFVSPSKIRIESDEVHYPLHIILRFEIELGLIEGSIEVKDLPKIWNEKMEELIGVVPKDDKEGVLQDVHWSEGYFGYFPTYAIGSIYAAQIYEQVKKEIPSFEEDLEKGDFTKIQNWLKEKIHKHGRKMFADDIIKSICGEGLNSEKYIQYLREKYSRIYDF